MPPAKTSIWLHDPNVTASGKAGAVQITKTRTAAPPDAYTASNYCKLRARPRDETKHRRSDSNIRYSVSQKMQKTTMTRNSPRKIRYRTMVLTMWIVVACLVGVSFVIRLPSVHVHMNITAANVMFRMMDRFPEDGPEVFSPWFVTGRDFLDEPEVVKVRSWNWRPGTHFLIGQSQRYYPPYHIAIAAWGAGEVNVVFDWLDFSEIGPDRWIFFGIPRLLDPREELVIGANRKWITENSIRISNLAVRSVTGAELTMEYQAANPSPHLGERKQETLRQESLVDRATIKILGKEFSLNPGDALWLDDDEGELRELNYEGNPNDINPQPRNRKPQTPAPKRRHLSDGRVGSIYARTEGKEVSLKPTIFDYLMSLPMLAKGISVILGLGTMIFLTVKWWRNQS